MAEDMRAIISSLIANDLRRLPTEKVVESQNTSGCPTVAVTIDGATYNITITRSRS